MEQKRKSKTALLNKRNAGIVKALGVCILVCLMFCLGFWLRGNTAFLNTLGFGGLAAEEAKLEQGTEQAQDSVSARIQEVESVLATDSIDSYDLNTATPLVLKALIDSTSDAYLSYYDEESYQRYLAGASKPDTGIGVLFGENNGACYVADVFEGSQAQACGVQAGDYVSSIDGVEKAQWSMPELMSALERNEGETVYVAWKRPATTDAQEQEFSTALPYVVQAATNISSELDDGVLYINVSQITSDAASLVRSIVEGQDAAEARALVLDLRDVPGGYLTQAVELASLFIPSGTVVQVQTKDALTVKSAEGKSTSSLPLVVLVNGRTTGSAEVLAAALQETKRASLVGTQTQGKGTIQVMQPLSFGGALRYTAASYLTPAGHAIEGSGVLPDTTIADVEAQKTTALELARSQISN